MQLYEDQEEFAGKLRAAVRDGHRSILGVASPAFGKTVLASHITAEARRRDPSSSVWFLVHRKNLLRQTSKSFARSRIEHGLLTSGRIRTNQPIQVGTIGTVYSRLQSLKPPKILFVDEAHLARGSMFEEVITWALQHGTLVIGLTGTPQRLDGKPLSSLFDTMVEARPTKWLIEQGRLSDYDLWSSPPPAVRMRNGEYDKTDSASVMSSRQIFGDVVDQWRKHANGMRTVAYCVDRAHARKTADYFLSCGISAVYVDGESTEAEIKDACEGLASGKYKILCNCELVIEGFDLSAQVGYDCTIECVILLRPTKSLARYLQMVFRALRAKPYKAVILDLAGCAHDHGMPCKIQEWSLDGKEGGGAGRSAAKDEVKIRQCPECWFSFEPGPDCCPNCGAPIQLTTRELEVIEGDLVKLEKENQQREQKRDQGMAREIDELVALGIRRGMKKPAQWAAITYAGRQKRKPTSAEFKQANDALLRFTQ